MDSLRTRFERPLVVGLVVLGLLFFIYLMFFVPFSVQTFGFDAFAYWSVSMPDPYVEAVGALGTFNYAPPVAQLAQYLSAVDFWVFLWLWVWLLIGTVVWIAGSPTWILVAFAIPFVALDLYHGNINILLAAAIVLGFKHPWTWALVLLTKPTAGVGLLWFAVRREWRPLGVALGTTLAISVVSFILAPQLWASWFELLAGGLGATPSSPHVPVPLWLRLPLAVVLVVWGARTDRRWTVVVSSMLALPVLWFAAPAMLVGVLPDLRDYMRRRREARAASTTDAEALT